MTVFYKKQVNNNEKQTSAYGKTYGRVVYTGTVKTEEIAERIQEKCALHTSDVIGCINALVTEIKLCLQNSQRVELTGLGTFKLGMSTRGVKETDDDKFTASDIKAVRVLFTPTSKRDSSTRVLTRALTTGVRFAEWGAEAKTSASSTTGGTTTGGSTTGGSSDSGTTSGGSSDSGSGSGGGSSDSGGANL